MIHCPSRMFRNATTVLLFLAATSALAEEGILVGEVPHGTTAPAILATTQRALLQGKWTILRTDETSVDAKRKDDGTDASLTVFVSDGILKYRGSAKVPKAWGVGKDTKLLRVDGSIPKDWLDDLRAGINQSLIVAVPHGKIANDTPANVDPADTARWNASPADEPRSNPGTSDKTCSCGSTTDKLRELEKLRKDGLVSEPEYQRMRQAALDAFPSSESPKSR